MGWVGNQKSKMLIASSPDQPLTANDSTPFGLYRDGTELRGVYYSKPNAARAACLSLGDACDYPILMGNDPLYGGMLLVSVFHIP